MIPKEIEYSLHSTDSKEQGRNGPKLIITMFFPVYKVLSFY